MSDQIRTNVQANLQNNRKHAMNTALVGPLPKFSEGDFVLVARSEFYTVENLGVRWRGPLCIFSFKENNDCVYQVVHLKNGLIEEAHATCLHL